MLEDVFLWSSDMMPACELMIFEAPGSNPARIRKWENIPIKCLPIGKDLNLTPDCDLPKYDRFWRLMEIGCSDV